MCGQWPPGFYLSILYNNVIYYKGFRERCLNIKYPQITKYISAAFYYISNDPIFSDLLGCSTLRLKVKYRFEVSIQSPVCERHLIKKQVILKKTL